MWIYKDYIRKAQSRIADQSGRIRTLFNGADGLLKTLGCSADRQTSFDAGSFIVRINYYLSRLSAAREELAGSQKLLEAGIPEENTGTGLSVFQSVRSSIIQAEQIILAIDREEAILKKCRDDLMILIQSQRQSSDVTAAAALKDFRDALRRYENGKEKDT